MGQRVSRTRTYLNKTLKNRSSKLPNGFNYLPAEIVYRILGYLNTPDPESRRTLLACSLACVNWNRAARRHIFSDIILSKPLIAFFIRNPSIAEAVRRIVMSGQDDGFEIICSHFDNVVEIQLSSVDLPFNHAPLWRSLCDNFDSLQALTLSNIRFDTHNHFVELITSFPRLKRLEAGGVVITSKPNTSPQPSQVASEAEILMSTISPSLNTAMISPIYSLHPQLFSKYGRIDSINFKKVTCTGTAIVSIYNLAEGLCPFLQLEELVLTKLQYNQANIATKLIASVSTSLRRLEINIIPCVYEEAEAFFKHIDLSSCTTLQTFSLPGYGRLCTDISLADRVDPPIPKLLLSIASVDLQEIQFEIVISETPLGKRVLRDLQNIDNALTGPNASFSKTLKKVIFLFRIIAHNESNTEFQTIKARAVTDATKSMRVLTQKRLLRFNFSVERSV